MQPSPWREARARGLAHLTPAQRWRIERAKALRHLGRAYDESEHPRDEHGQWTSGGGGDGGGSAGTSSGGTGGTSGRGKDASELFHANDQYVDLGKALDAHAGARDAITKAEKLLSQSVATDEPVSRGGYLRPDGSYTPERQKVHERILRDMFTKKAIAAATPKAGEKPTLNFFGGRGGSGKSWFTDTGLVDKNHSIYINSDDIKESFPGYAGWNSPHFHEEATYVANVAQEMARRQGLNVIYDATMRSAGSNEKITKKFKDAGYGVNAYYMYATPQQAAERAIGRFMRGAKGDRMGRFVPPEYIAASSTNELTFDALRDKFDDWKVFDNSKDGGPKLFAEKEKKK